MTDDAERRAKLALPSIYNRDLILPRVADAIRAAVAAERDRCAAIVTACDPDTVYVSGSDGEEYAGGVSIEQAREWILARIRPVE